MLRCPKCEAVPASSPLGKSPIAIACAPAAHFVSNTPMQHTDTTDQRLTELEIKASFSEDLLDQLNQVVVRQQQEIDSLMREVRQLRLQLPEGNAPGFARASDELPPHY